MEKYMKTYRVSFGASHLLLAAAFTLGVSGPAFSYGTIEGSKTRSDLSAQSDLIQLAGAVQGGNGGGGLGGRSGGGGGGGGNGTGGNSGNADAGDGGDGPGGAGGNGGDGIGGGANDIGIGGDSVGGN